MAEKKYVLKLYLVGDTPEAEKVLNALGLD
jgi:hypothetical protein